MKRICVILIRAKLGVKTNPYRRAKEETMRCFASLNMTDCFLSRKLLECVRILAPLLLLSSLALSGSRPSATRLTGTISERFLGVACEIRAIHIRRRQSDRAARRNARLVSGEH